MPTNLSFTVSDLWRRLALPGEPKPLCRCPFHTDRNASFSIYQGGKRWKCHTGCGSGDAIAFFAKATGLTNVEAFRKVRKLAGDGIIPVVGVSSCTKPDPKRGNPVLPADLHQGSRTELQQVASLRGLSLAGVELASERGLLRFGRVCGSPCWIVTDGRRVLAQARRMDGKPFPAFGSIGERKAHTIKGSRQGWPLGIDEATPFPSLLLVEGGPDVLAACHFIAQAGRQEEFAPVAMLGASNRIPPETLPLFREKRVRIYPHNDLAGNEAAARWAWAIEIEGFAGPPEIFRFEGLVKPDGLPVGDLNDLARMDAAEQPEGLL